MDEKFKYLNRDVRGCYSIKKMSLPVYISETYSYVECFLIYIKTLPLVYFAFVSFLDGGVLKEFLIASYLYFYFISCLALFEIKFTTVGRGKFTRSTLLTTNELLNRSLLFKTEAFRNTPKWDLIFFRMLIPVLSIFFIVKNFKLCGYTSDSEVGFAGGALGLWIGLSYHFFSLKSKQYETCYKEITDYLKKLKFQKEEKFQAYINASSLALDLFHMDFWAHKSFREFFGYWLGNAIELARNEYNTLDNWKEIITNDTLNRIQNSEFEYIINYKGILQNDCRNLLNFMYQYYLKELFKQMENPPIFIKSNELNKLIEFASNLDLKERDREFLIDEINKWREKGKKSFNTHSSEFKNVP